MMNWIHHNLNQRLLDKTLDFKVTLIPSKFKVMSFHNAADYTAQQIANLNIPLYLGLSGGVDSEYVLICFYRNQIPIIPIIIKTSGNKSETSFAFHICQKLNITPIVLNLSDNDNLSLVNYCFNKFNVYAQYTIPCILASNYAKKNNGILITGNHFIDDINTTIQNVDAAEWDFYHIFLSNKNDINFYSYNPEITYSMIYQINELPVNKFKCQLYQIRFRPKILPIYNKYVEFYTKKSLNLQLQKYPNYHYIFGKKEEVLSMMEKWNVD